MVSVKVVFNGGYDNYQFDRGFDEFVSDWSSQVKEFGFFKGLDVNGNIIVINPSNCGTVEIQGGK